MMDVFPALFASCPPAETRRLGPWLLRRSGGGARRARCVTLEGAFEDAGPSLDAVLAQLAQWGERPVFMVRGGEDRLDALLAARGFALEDAVVLMAGDAATMADRRADVSVIDCDGPIAVLRELWPGIDPARLAVMERVTGPKRYLLGRLGDRPAGAGFVSVGAGAAVLNALQVAPWARRRGLGRRIVGWAAAWAAEAGAPVLALGVEADNALARALYSRLGMEEAGGYHYRSAPT